MKKLVYRTRDICEMISLSRSQLHRLVTSGRFPAPIRLGGPHAVGYLAEEVDRWLAERVTTARSAECASKEAR